MDGLVMRFLVTLWLACLSGIGMAQAPGLPDPTRPPAGVMSAPGASSPEASEVSGPRLQSVILRPDAKPRALINDEWLELGQSMGDSKIVKIAADRVELKGAQGRQTLKLTPDVDKQMPKPPSGIQRQEKSK